MEKKKAFKMPHLLWIMFGIILVSCLATYLIPAGQFATNEAGEIMGTEFEFLGHQTPVNPWDALMLMKSGMGGGCHHYVCGYGVGCQHQCGAGDRCDG